jgi:hypothetical protein
MNIEPLTVQPDNTTGYIKIIYGLLLGSGLFITGSQLYDYFQYQMIGNWLNLFTGICLFIAGLLGFRGSVFGKKYKVTIDEHGITPENGWDNPVSWDQLKSVWLDQNYIRFEYRVSGAEDKIRLPVYSQDQHELVHKKLAEAAEEFDLDYGS